MPDTSIARQFFMGIDRGGYDRKTFCICVMSRPGGVEYAYCGHDEKEFDTELEKMKTFYEIPDDFVFQEIK